MRCINNRTSLEFPDAAARSLTLYSVIITAEAKRNTACVVSLEKFSTFSAKLCATCASQLVFRDRVFSRVRARALARFQPVSSTIAMMANKLRPAIMIAHEMSPVATVKLDNYVSTSVGAAARERRSNVVRARKSSEKMRLHACARTHTRAGRPADMRSFARACHQDRELRSPSVSRDPRDRPCVSSH